MELTFIGVATSLLLVWAVGLAAAFRSDEARRAKPVPRTRSADAWEQVAAQRAGRTEFGELGYVWLGGIAGFLDARLSLQVGQCSVVVSEVQGGIRGGRLCTVVQVTHPEIPSDLLVRREQGNHDLQVGDTKFDRLVAMEGSERSIRATMQAPLRESLSQAFTRPQNWLRFIRLEGGCVTHFALRACATPEALNDAIDQAVTWANWFAIPGGDSTAAIAKVAATDPEVRVRARAVEFIGDQALTAPERRRHLEPVLKDSDADVRILAAGLLDGQDAIDLLIHLVRDEALDVGVRSRAAATLAEHHWNHASDDLSALLRGSEPRVVASLVEALSASACREFSTRLVKLLESEDASLAVVAAAALGRAGDVRAEPALLSMLASQETSLALAAGRALATCGTEHALAPLHARAKGWRVPAELRSVVSVAVTEIEARKKRG